MQAQRTSTLGGTVAMRLDELLSPSPSPLPPPGDAVLGSPLPASLQSRQGGESHRGHLLQVNEDSVTWPSSSSRTAHGCVSSGATTARRAPTVSYTHLRAH